MRHAPAALLIALTLGAAWPAWARQTGRSFLDADVDPATRRVTLRLELPARDLADYQRLDTDADGAHTAADLTPPSAAAQTLGLITSHLGVVADRAPCPRASASRVDPTRPGPDAAFLLTFQCPRPIGELTVVNRLMTNDRWGYQHSGTLRAPGVAPTSVVFDIELDRATLTVDPDPKPPTPNPLERPAPAGALALCALAGLLTWGWARR